MVVPESLGEDSVTTRVSCPTIAVVKQTIMVMWVQLPPRSQIGYAEIRGEDMPQGALVPNATISDYHLLPVRDPRGRESEGNSGEG